MTFAERLLFLRTGMKLTQTELANRLGMSTSAVSMYENGKREPDFDTLELLADFFNVDTDYLLGREERTVMLLDSEQLEVANAYAELTDEQRILVRRLLGLE